MSKENDKDISRRKFLKAAGKFAAYTPPALLIMSKPGDAWAVNSCNQGVGDPVVRDGCQPGKSGEVLNNDDFPEAGTGNPGASN